MAATAEQQQLTGTVLGQIQESPAASMVDRIQRLIRVLERFEQEEQGER